mgnify:CR=1 FL=1
MLVLVTFVHAASRNSDACMHFTLKRSNPFYSVIFKSFARSCSDFHLVIAD